MRSGSNQQQYPARGDLAGGDIVAGYVDGQPTDAPDSADDGVHVGNQDVLPDPPQRYILAEGGAQDDVRVASLNEGKDTPLQDIQ
jgi:hypothetical protein